MEVKMSVREERARRSRSSRESSEEEENAIDSVTSVRDFVKIKRLGAGDSGRVYLVMHRKTNRFYAMKVVSKEDMKRRKKVRRILAERELMLAADHPLIATLHYAFQSKNFLFLVMEYCGGGELWNVMKKRKHHNLEEHEVKFYSAEILLAMEFLHMKGYIYRDLKPENILVSSSGHARLGDFDLCSKSELQKEPQLVYNRKGGFWNKMLGRRRKSLIDDPSTVPNSARIGVDTDSFVDHRRNRRRSFVGTDEYLAPEILSGEGHSESLDWWTFGILLYELMFGESPFKAATRKATYENILDAELHFPQHIKVSKEAKDIIRSLLQRDPERRLGSRHGASEIKGHKWYHDIKFEFIRNAEPPFRPQIALPSPERVLQLASEDVEKERWELPSEWGAHRPSETFQTFAGGENPRHNRYGGVVASMEGSRSISQIEASDLAMAHEGMEDLDVESDEESASAGSPRE